MRLSGWLSPLFVVFAACASPTIEDSSSTESGYTAIAEGSPEAKGVLRVANEATSSELRMSVGLSEEVTRNIVAVRVGDDAVAGTSDDTTFTSLAQLDAVPFVTSAVFDQLLDYAKRKGLVVRPPTNAGAPGTWTVVPHRAGWSPGTAWTAAATWVDGSGVLDVNGRSSNRYEPSTDLVFAASLPNDWKSALYQPVVAAGSNDALAASYSYSADYPSGPSVSVARFDRTTRTWSSATTNGLELERQAAVVWAGDRYVVVQADPYGNSRIGAQSLTAGAAAWSAVSTYNGAGVGRFYGAYWTGHDVLVWGEGVPIHFDPTTATWHSGPAPARNFRPNGYAATWDGKRLVSIMDRLAYDPASETWSPISAVGAPPDCKDGVTALVGRKIVVWGGASRNEPYGYGYREALCSAEGGVYDLDTDTWKPIAHAPKAIRVNALFATDGHMLWIGGGRGGTLYPNQTEFSEIGDEGDLVYVP